MNYLIVNILYVLILLLHSDFILFIYFLGDISITLAINSRLNKGLLLLLYQGYKQQLLSSKSRINLRD